jgi:hypothetical protein
VKKKGAILNGTHRENSTLPGKIAASSPEALLFPQACIYPILNLEWKHIYTRCFALNAEA